MAQEPARLANIGPGAGQARSARPAGEIAALETAWGGKTAPWTAWQAAYQDRLDRLDRLASNFELNFVTIRPPSPGKLSPLQAPRSPHGKGPRPDLSLSPR